MLSCYSIALILGVTAARQFTVTGAPLRRVSVNKIFLCWGLAIVLMALPGFMGFGLRQILFP